MANGVGGGLFELDCADTSIPGGTNTSHTIAVDHLRTLLRVVPSKAAREQYLRAAVEENLLGRATLAGRRRTFRYLRELYLLDPSRIMFRALRDLWDEDEIAQPLIAGLAAYARDNSFRASAEAVLPTTSGEVVSSDDLAHAVMNVFPGVYNAATAGKIGRNTGSSWAQTGHLIGRSRKTRQRVEARPAAAAYAMLLAHLEGARGTGLFETCWTTFLDATPHEMRSLVDLAARRGYLEYRSAGGVVEVGFRHLLRPIERSLP